jgi:excisionase family DNA binding protein
MPEHLDRFDSIQQPALPPLLSKEQAAHLLSTTPRHVERLIEDGRLGYVKVGRFVRFTMLDIDQYLTAAHIAARAVSE